MRPSPQDSEQTELATGFTVGDYKTSRQAQDRQKIAEAIRKRFTERYINPAGADTPHKHGFTMMAISCLMIEALESFRQGWTTSDGQSKAAFCFFFDDADVRGVQRTRAAVLQERPMRRNHGRLESRQNWPSLRSRHAHSERRPVSRNSGARFGWLLQ